MTLKLIWRIKVPSEPEKKGNIESRGRVSSSFDRARSVAWQSRESNLRRRQSGHTAQDTLEGARPTKAQSKKFIQLIPIKRRGVPGSRDWVEKRRRRRDRSLGQSPTHRRTQPRRFSNDPAINPHKSLPSDSGNLTVNYNTHGAQFPTLGRRP